MLAKLAISHFDFHGNAPTGAKTSLVQTVPRDSGHMFWWPFLSTLLLVFVFPFANLGAFWFTQWNKQFFSRASRKFAPEPLISEREWAEYKIQVAREKRELAILLGTKAPTTIDEIGASSEASPSKSGKKTEEPVTSADPEAKLRAEYEELKSSGQLRPFTDQLNNLAGGRTPPFRVGDLALLVAYDLVEASDTVRLTPKGKIFAKWAVQKK